MSEASVQVSLPTTVEAVDLVHDALDDLWTIDDSVAAGDRFRLTSAVVEIVGNVVEHAFRLDESGGEGRRLDVMLVVRRGAIEAVVADNGLPASIDLSSVELPGSDAESGRGLALAMASLDEVSYERVDGRNQWVLRCRRADS